MEVKPLRVELSIGHKTREVVDGKPVVITHRVVTFGKRICGGDLFKIDGDPQATLPTQYQDLLLRTAITEFGTLKMPVGLQVLLSLDSIDRDDLSEAYDRFSREFLGEAQADYQSDRQVKLAIGYEMNGLVYDVVEFGTRLVGMDEVRADKLGYKAGSIRRVCYLAGRQVVKLSQSEGGSVLDGPLELQVFEALDAVDIQAIRIGSEVWRHSFRRPGARVPRHGAGPDGSATGGEDGVERGANTQLVN